MRIRGTKPEFWKSARIASVDWDARLVLKGLESYVDDNGVGKDDLELIAGDLFSRDAIRDSSRTLARVSEAISSLASAGLVWRYEDDGQPLLFVAFWEQVQRVDKPQPGRFRRPDGTLNYKDSEIRAAVARAREDSRALAPVTGEQGNRGTGEQTLSSAAPRTDKPAPLTPSTPSTPDDRFEEFYGLYPRKEGRGQAVKAWRAALKKGSADVVIAGLREQLPSLRMKERRFQPLPASWLTGERWLDEVIETSSDEDPLWERASRPRGAS